MEEMREPEAEQTVVNTAEADKPSHGSSGSGDSRESRDLGPVNDRESNDGTDDEFYPYIRCALCDGFYIDATTITECLHTFCKSCIVKHFFYSNRCPNCNIVVHQTQPLYNIRPDRQLQDIVFKMLPDLEERERERMTAFYKQRGLEVPKPVAVSQIQPAKPGKQKKELMPQSVFTIPSELDVSLVLEFVGAEEGIENYKPLERKYVRVSGEATVRHVQLFIRRKMELSSGCQVDLVCGEQLLDGYQSLKEVLSSTGTSGLQVSVGRAGNPVALSVRSTGLGELSAHIGLGTDSWFCNLGLFSLHSRSRMVCCLADSRSFGLYNSQCSREG